MSSSDQRDRAIRAWGNPPIYPSSELEPLQVVELSLTGVTICKCIGDEQTMRDYFQKSKPQVTSDWSAIYTQFDMPHSLGTVGYRWDAGYQTANVMQAPVTSGLRCVVVDAPWMCDGSIQSDAKAAAVRLALGLSDSEPLMDAIGQRGMVLVCRETEMQWEMVIPHTLGLERVIGCEQQVMMQLRPNQYGSTGQVRSWDAEQLELTPWRRFDENEALVEVRPPQWILEALAANA